MPIYDEFIEADRQRVRGAVARVRDDLIELVGPKAPDILTVLADHQSPHIHTAFTERDLRVMWWALNFALVTL